jgi:YhcH/YjgK/YiaL family protein
MKKLSLLAVQFIIITIFMANNFVKAQTSGDDAWTKEKAAKWVKTREWANGLKLKAYDSIDVKEFAKQYHKNKKYWDKAFEYLKNTNLDTLSPGRYDIDGNNVYVSVTQNKTKAFEDTKWEDHHRYIDIQYVIKGKEKMGVAPVSKATILDAYNDKKDNAFYQVSEKDSKYYVAQPGTFYVFFPQETHRPNIKVTGCDEDKKIVIKVKADEQINVGLDTWFNHETSPRTGKPYHYLWTDSAFSGYSRWGKIFTSRNANISTLNRPNAANLANLGVYIIVDPDTTSENPAPNYILPEDATAIEQWVKNGGVLIILGNDAPNCEFTHLNQLASRFGIIFNYVTLLPVTDKKWEMGAVTALPDHPLFKGIKKIYLKEVSSLTLSGQAKPVLTHDGNILMAECQYGKGFVFAVGDPWIYNEYIDHDRLPVDFENHKAAENLTDYLLLKAAEAKK